MTLSKQTRDAIGRCTGRLRRVLEAEYTAAAAGRYGLHVEPRTSSTETAVPAALSAHVEPPTALSLSPSGAQERSELLGALTYLVTTGYSGSDAVRRLVREAAFTTVNRLLTIRVAESLSLLPSTLASGRSSSGPREIIDDLFPVLGAGPDAGYWAYIEASGDELAPLLPALFDRRLPTSAFVPSHACLDELLNILNHDEVVDAWSEPEALGWAYQFFNSQDERGQMRAESQAPRNSRELAVRNQFFTPRYVVDWLVQNTLGRVLLERGVRRDLASAAGTAVAQTGGGPAELAELSVLDPACGSGHFLLGCYDLLERAWAAEGVSPSDAAPFILSSLHGIDIDPRASQVAQAALLLRAQREGRRADLQPPRIVTARSLPDDKTVIARVTAALPPSAASLVHELAQALQPAGVLGPLLKVEQQLRDRAEHLTSAPMLGDEAGSAHALREMILAALRDVAAPAESDPASRLFAAEASDAVRFVELCDQRYDVVLMNPPFGDAVPATKDYLKTAYGSAGGDLYSAFVARGVELLKPDGYVGAITSRAGFFLTTFRDWRSETVLPRLHAMLDLGLGVMHDAMVEAAAYVLGKRRHDDPATFVRLLVVRLIIE